MPAVPPPGNPRFALLDPLRALAALSVFAYHVAFFAGALASGPGGALLSQLDSGVTLFFAISGFVLYRPMVRARQAGEPALPLRSYAANRLLRIVPAYWLALTVLALYPGLSGVFGDRWWVYYGLGQVYAQDTILSGIWPAWSLGTELAFYAVLPLLAVALAARPPRAQLAALGALAVASVGFRVAVAWRSGAPFLAQTLPGTFAWFALGMALAVASVAAAAPGARPGRLLALARSRPAAGWALALAAYVALAAVSGPDRGFLGDARPSLAQVAGTQVLSGLFAVLVLAPAVVREDRPRVPSLPVLTWLGTVSYGIYLWHYPILQRVATGSSTELRAGAPALRTAAVALPITLACAAASYYALERPLLRRKPSALPRSVADGPLEARDGEGRADRDHRA